MKYIPVVFYVLLGLFFLGVPFPFLKIILGILAFILALMALG